MLRLWLVRRLAISEAWATIAEVTQMHAPSDVLRALALADDFTVVRAFEHLHGRLVERLGVPLLDLAQELKSDSRASSAVHSQLDVFLANEVDELPEDQSVAAARRLLVTMGSDSEGAALVIDCLMNWPDDRKSVGKVLSIGLVGAVWLLIATTHVTLKDGRVMVDKQPINVEKLEIDAKEISGVLQVHSEQSAPHGRGRPRIDKPHPPSAPSASRDKQP